MKKIEEGRGRCVQPFYNGLTVDKLAGFQGGDRLFLERGSLLEVIRDDEALNPQALADDNHQIARAGHRRIVACDPTTHGDPAIVAQYAQCGFELRTACVVEVGMNPVGSTAPQMFERVSVAIIEGIVDLELIAEEAHLFFGAGTGDHLATANARQLAGRIPDRACASRHKDCLADLQVRYPVNAHPCRQAGYAQNSKVCRGPGGCCIDDLQARSRRNKRLSPPVDALDIAPYGEFLILRGDDSSDSTTFQRLTDLKWRNVGLGVIHPPAHVGIDGDAYIAHQRFPGIGVANLHSCKREIVHGGFSLRTGGKTNFTTFSWHGCRTQG